MGVRIGSRIYKIVQEEQEMAGKITYEYIPVREMFPNELFQRETNWGRVNQIAKNWNEALYEPISVCAHVEGYSIIDGQHRYLAAQKAGITELYCRVFHGLDKEAEARLFVDLGVSRKPLTKTDIFIGRVQGGDPVHNRAKEILYEYGLLSPKDLRRDSKGRHLPIAAIERIITRPDGIKRLETILDLMRKAWDGDRYNYQGWVFRGLDRCYDVFADRGIDLNGPQVLSKFQTVPLVSVLRKAAELSPASRGTAKNLMNAFLYFYNTHKRKDSRILPGGNGE